LFDPPAPCSHGSWLKWSESFPCAACYSHQAGPVCGATSPVPSCAQIHRLTSPGRGDWWRETVRRRSWRPARAGGDQGLALEVRLLVLESGRTSFNRCVMVAARRAWGAPSLLMASRIGPETSAFIKYNNFVVSSSEISLSI